MVYEKRSQLHHSTLIAIVETHELAQGSINGAPNNCLHIQFYGREPSLLHELDLYVWKNAISVTFIVCSLLAMHCTVFHFTCTYNDTLQFTSSLIRNLIYRLLLLLLSANISVSIVGVISNMYSFRRYIKLKRALAHEMVRGHSIYFFCLCRNRFNKNYNIFRENYDIKLGEKLYFVYKSLQ